MSVHTEIDPDDAASRVEAVLAAVTSWPGVRIAAAPTGGRAIRLGRRQVGLVRYAGTVAVAYPRALRAPLVAAGWTAPDPVVPASGRTVLRIRSAADIDRAVALLRGSYPFHALDRPGAPEGTAAPAALDLGAGLDALAPPRAIRAYLSALAAGNRGRGGRTGADPSAPGPEFDPAAGAG